MKINELINEIENQMNPIIIGLNFKLDALISVLDNEQLKQYKAELNKKKKEVTEKLSSRLTKEQLHSILQHLD